MIFELYFNTYATWHSFQSNPVKPFSCLLKEYFFRHFLKTYFFSESLNNIENVCNPGYNKNRIKTKHPVSS